MCTSDTSFPQAIENAVTQLRNTLLAAYENDVANAIDRNLAVNAKPSARRIVNLDEDDSQNNRSISFCPVPRSSHKTLQIDTASEPQDAVKGEVIMVSPSETSEIVVRQAPVSPHAGVVMATSSERSHGEKNSYRSTATGQSRTTSRVIGGKFLNRHGASSVEFGSRVFHNANSSTRAFSQAYHFLLAGVIAFNTVLLIVHYNYVAYRSPNPETTRAIFALQAICCAAFVTDIAYRLWRLKLSFFYRTGMSANIIDMSVVICMLVGLAIEAGSTEMGTSSHLVAISALRGFHVASILYLKPVQEWLLRTVPEIRLLLLCLQLTMRLIVVVCMLVFPAVCFTALPLAQSSLHHCDIGNEEVYCRHFGSFARSAFTLIQAMFGGLLWGELWDTLENADVFTKVVFLFFIAFSLIVMGNMIALVLHTVGNSVFNEDKTTQIEKERQGRDFFYGRLRELFDRMDINRSGAISKDEIELAMIDEEIVTCFAMLELEPEDVHTMYEQMEEGRGAVGVEEFLLGCRRLKGGAKAADMVTLHVELQSLLHYILELRKAVEESSISTTPTLPGARVSLVKGHYRRKARSPHGSRNSIGADSVTASHSMKSHHSNSFAALSHREGLPPIFARSDFAWGQIKKVEERALTIGELHDVNLALSLCDLEEWQDMKTGERLNVEDVDLYHFAYHLIQPLAIPDGVDLVFSEVIDESTLEKYVGSPLFQKHGTLVRAEGVISKVLAPSSVHVDVSKGKFRESSSLVAVIGDDALHLTVETVDAPGSCSYKELISAKPTKPLWFCSHWWGESVADFVLCCESHRRQRGIDDNKATYWVCAYANRQYELSDELGSCPEDSSFYKAMMAAEGVLLHLDKNAVCFTRIWCCFEIFKAISTEGKRLDITTVISEDGRRIPQLLSDGPLPEEAPRNQMFREERFPITLFVKGICARLEEGKASVQSDKDNIIKSFGGDQSLELQSANKALHSFFAKAAWTQAVKKGIVNDFDTDHPGSVSLPQVLKANDTWKSFNLSMEHCEVVTDDHVGMLGEGLPLNLREVHLSFEGCPLLTSECLKKLAPNLPPDLNTLKLDFLGCHLIGDQGIGALSSFIANSHLHNLSLHFDKCYGVTRSSAVDLGSCLPSSIREFKGTFRGTQLDRNFDAASELKAYARSIAKETGHNSQDLAIRMSGSYIEQFSDKAMQKSQTFKKRLFER